MVTVSFRQSDRDYWCDQATFMMYNDALFYAQWLSTRISRDATVRCEDGRGEFVNVYCRNGVEVVNEECMA